MKPTLLLFGSSIMEQWHRAQALAPGWRVVNRAIGGTTTSDWIDHLDAVLRDEKPDAAFAYVGSNDLARGGTAASIAQGVRRCRDRLHARCPAAPLAYLAIIKAPQRRGRFDDIAAANHAAREQLKPHDLWLESDPVMLADHSPIHAYYLDDGLHLRPEAYLALTAHLAPQLHTWLPQTHAPPRKA